jgi:hypothetical protein
MAKKSKPPMKIFPIKVSAEELAAWRAIAGAAGLPVAEMVRQAVRDATIVARRSSPPPPQVDPRLIQQLAAIGNNLNQIARRVNTGERFAVLIELRRIADQLDRIEEKCARCTVSG